MEQNKSEIWHNSINCLKKQVNELKKLDNCLDKINEIEKLKTEINTLYMVLGAYYAYETEEGFLNYVRSVLQNTEKRYIKLSKL